MNKDLIIDFERLNQLTAHPNDNPNSNNSITGAVFTYNISRKILKDYMEIYVGYNPSQSYRIGNRQGKVTEEEYNNIVNTLKHNRILITSADIRDKKINIVLDECDDDDVPF